MKMRDIPRYKDGWSWSIYIYIYILMMIMRIHTYTWKTYLMQSKVSRVASWYVYRSHRVFLCPWDARFYTSIYNDRSLGHATAFLDTFWTTPLIQLSILQHIPNPPPLQHNPKNGNLITSSACPAAAAAVSTKHVGLALISTFRTTLGIYIYIYHTDIDWWYMVASIRMMYSHDILSCMFLNSKNIEDVRSGLDGGVSYRHQFI
jgi:hypothetical protein